MDDPKSSAVVAAYTGSFSLGLLLDLFSKVLGIIGVILGIILSAVLIYNHWRNGRLNYEKTRLEIDLMKEKEDRRKAEAQERKKQGLPLRRTDD